MKREEFFKELLKDVSGTYVEIGTCWGGFAEFLLLNTACTSLICIDPYRVFSIDVYYDSLNFQPQHKLDEKFLMVLKRLVNNSANKPVTMMRLTSYEAAKQVYNNLAFVYIDGNHHHKEVLKDLTVWWPKIRKGGLLCGDDVEDLKLKHEDGDVIINHNASCVGKYGVATALEDFARVVPDFKYKIVGNQFYAYK